MQKNRIALLLGTTALSLLAASSIASAQTVLGGSNVTTGANAELPNTQSFTIQGGSQAAISGSTTLSSSAEGTRLTQTNNGFSADLIGNNNSQGVTAQPLDAFSSTVSVGSLQTVTAGTGSVVDRSKVLSSSITATSTDQLTQAITQSSLATASNATANQSAQSIGIASGAVSTVASGTTTNQLQQNLVGTTAANNLVAGLGIANGQNNSGGAFTASVTSSPIQSVVSTGGIASTGSITQSQDRLNATAISNNATASTIVGSASIPATSFAGTAGIQNQQATSGSAISSTVTESGVLASVTGAVAGTVTQSGNALLSSATSNAFESALSVNAATISDTAGLASLSQGVTGTDPDFVRNATATADLSINSQQSNATSAVTATIEKATSGVGSDIAATYSAGLSGASTQSGNSISGAAVGNQTASTLGVTGTTGSFTAGVGAQQVGESSVTANVSNSTVYTSVTGALTGAVTSTANTTGATATANQSSNTLSVALTTATLGAGGLVSADSDSLSGAIGSTATTTTMGSNAANGVLAVSNQQLQLAATSATLDPGAAGLTGLSAGSISGGTVTVSRDALSAAATANKSANNIALDATTITSGSGVGEQIASLGNWQQTTGASTSTLTSRVVGVSSGAVTNSELTVSGNTVAGAASGNAASNSVAVTGTTLSLAPPAGGFVPSTTYTSGTTTAATTADFALQSMQASSGAVTSTVEAANTGVVSTGAVNGGSVVVTANNLSSETRANVAQNSLAFGAAASPFGSLTTTGAVQNYQTSSSTTASTLTLGNVGLAATDLGATAATAAPSLSVDRNTALATSYVNSASNQLSAFAADVNAGTTSSGANAFSDLATGADGNFVLQNAQTGSGASASSTVQNGVFGANLSATAGQSSTITVAGNTASAVSAVNASNNLMYLSASASMASSGAVSNVQAADGASSSTVNNVDFGVQTAGDTLLSSQTIANNTGSASAFGNSATSTLVAYSPAGYGLSGTVSGSATGTVSTASANYAVLNAQTNSGAVTGSVTGSAIGYTGTGGTIAGASSIVGNSFTASAVGNQATSSLVLASTTGTMPSTALANRQSNTGAVVASVSGSTIGLASSGAATGGTTMANNRITATATGNASTTGLSVIR